MNLAQTATRHQFQARLDELHEISIALYAEVVAVMQRIEEIAIEREQVYREWETSWNEPTPAVTPAVKTISAKKLMLSLVSVKRITSDVASLQRRSQRTRNCRFAIVWRRRLCDSQACWYGIVAGFRVVSGHFQFHAAVLARRLNPKAGETIPAFDRTS